MSTVVAQPYSTAGNGGRKLVRLSNGWLVAAVKNEDSTQSMRFYKSTDNGISWQLLVILNFFTGNYSIVSSGTDIFVLLDNMTNNVYSYKIDALTASGTVISGVKVVDTSQSAISNVSLAIDPTNGHLHAAWASKNATYPNSFNIRYAKSTDGGATWSAVEQVTAYNTTGNAGYTNPSIVIKNGTPNILSEMKGGQYFIALMSTSFTDKTLSTGGSALWGNKHIYNGGAYAQSNPSAVVDKDGVIHVAWGGSNPFEIMYANSSNNGTSWSTPKKLATGAVASITVDKDNQLSIVYNNGDIYYIKSIDKGLNWTTPSTQGKGSEVSTLYDGTFAGSFGALPPTIYKTSTSVDYMGTYTTNSAPIVTSTSPTDNLTLYENDTLNISGNAYDADKDQSVTAYYQINSEARKVLATNLSQTQIALSKQLTFKGGKLYDADTAVTDTLSDGVAHTLKVWAVDSEGAQSSVETRSFYVVPNRAPLLTVNNPTPSGIIDVDSFSISGTYSDADGNATTVVYRINGGNSVQIAQGISGDFTFDVTLGSLQIGVNAITIEATDSYGAKTTKTVKLNKAKVATPITRSTVRYKVAPPTGKASEILVWVQRDANLTLNGSVSMTLSGEAESFVTMTKNATSSLSDGRVEDEFYHQVAEAKDSIVLKFDLTKSSVDADEAITLITGVF